MEKKPQQKKHPQKADSAFKSGIDLSCKPEVTEHTCCNLSQSGFFLLQNGFVL